MSRLKVTRESSTGRNIGFKDAKTGREMTRAETVREIKSGTYDDYHVRKVNGVETPCSNPDRSEKNNLG